MSEKEEKLFSEFPAVTTEEWEAVINKDLKGADYDKKLIWKTGEGFTVKPYYRAEDLQNLDYLTRSVPSEAPFTRGGNAHSNQWDIVQEIKEKDAAKANAIALDALMKGANVIVFCSKNITTAEDLAVLLKNIDLSIATISFSCSDDYLHLAKLYMQYIESHHFDKVRIIGSFQWDPIVEFLKFKQGDQAMLSQLLEMHRLMESVPHFKYLTVNAAFLNHCGATIVQELGYALAIANEYLAYATDNHLSIDDILPRIAFCMSIGSNYFMEIAKLRAARLLWSTIVKEYHPKLMLKMNIFSKSSTWNKTIYDPYVNMLRTTTEGMSAALGGADQIALTPFDVTYKQADEFSSRIARNTQILLKEESYFDKVVDPAAGSYYIENLTDNIGEQAWNLFNEVESSGGITAYINSGKLKESIEASCQQRDMEIATRKKVFLGTNQYPNIKEEMLGQVEKTGCCCNGKSHYLKPYRGAMPFEELRLATERWAKEHGRPKVFLFKMGNVAMRQARAGFVTNFFGCAGYEIVETSGYQSVEEGMKDVINAQPQLVVLCSSDEEYMNFAEQLVGEVKKNIPAATCIVAGNPEQTEALKAAGVDDFVHVRVNLLETLRRYNQMLGIV